MTRHRNLRRWRRVLPGFIALAALSASPTSLAAPPEGDDFDEGDSEDGFDFDEGDSPEGDDEGFDFDEGEGDSPEGGIVIAPTAAPEGDEGKKGDGDTEGPGEDDGLVDDWGDEEGEISEDDEFVFEDISEDEEALEEELKSGEVQAEGETGTVSGVVHNAKGEPLAGVYVRAKGTKYVARTGVDGDYELKLPPGSHTLLVELDLYKSAELPELNVVAGEVTSQEVELVPMAGVMETFEVADELNMEAEGALQEARKQSSSVSDGIDATEISKSGGGSVASVAVRIVGATVVDGRYLFVRGLGHRYGNTLLDGARVPSPEPELRTVPLDVFPTGALSAIDIQKTFSPDVPGDFTGGSTRFVTRDAPEEPTISIGLWTGINTNTSFRPMVTDAGYAAYDFFALGNIPRAVPDSFPSDQPVGRGALDENLQDLYTTEEIEAQGEALDTRTKIIRGRRAPANFGLELTSGNSWTLNDNGGKFGVLFSGAYKNEHQTNREQYGMVNAQADAFGNQTVDFESLQTEVTTAYNGLLKLQLDANSDNRFALTGFYSREARDETRDIYGMAQDVAPGDLLNYTRQRYTVNSIAFTQLRGKHRVRRAGDMEVEYFGSFSQARRDDPALREMVFRYNADNEYFHIDDSTGPTGKQLFLGLVDNNENAALDLSFPFRQWKGLDSKVKFGAWVDAKQRDFRVRRFDYAYAGGLSDQIPIGRDNPINPDTIGGGISAANGGTEPFFLADRLQPSDNYRAWSRNLSGYALLELPFVNWFKITGGVRLESNVIDAEPYDLYDPEGADELERARLVDLDWLPAAALIFSPGLPEGGGDLNIRLGGSRTLARPEFRELAPFQFRDYVGGFNKLGYSELRSTRIWNADLRVEWFPRPSEVLAISGFFKQFTDPIEEVVGASAGSPVASWANAEGALNGGVELEFRKALDFMAPKHADAARDVLRDISVGANFAYIYSRVRLGSPCYLPGTEPPENLEGAVPVEGCRTAFQVSTSRERPLQGQSPWIVNAYLDYDNGDTGTNVRVMYNAFGPYISQVQGLGLPDIYHQPMHQIDVNASQRLFAYRRNDWGDLRHQLILNFEVENLINTRKALTIGRDPDGPVFYGTRDGVGFKVGLTWKY